MTGDRCGSEVEWVPYSLDDDSGDGEEAFWSWRRRKGVDPVVAGPRWSEIKGKLEASGVDVWWDPRAGQRRAAPKARGRADGREEARPEGHHEEGGGVAAQAQQPPGGKKQGKPVAAAAREGRGQWTAWGRFALFLSCVGVAGVGCMGRTKRRKRRGGTRRRKQVMEWSHNAFSTTVLSPLAGKGTTTQSPSFGWKGPVRSKRHHV